VSKKAKTAIVIGSVVIIIALLVTIIVLLLQGKEDKGQQADAEKRATVVNEDNAEQVVEEMVNKEYIAPGYYNAKMTNEWHFANGNAASEDAYVANDQGNTNDVFFDVVLAEDESKVIYKSPVIPRGGELEGIKLDEALGAGTYDCVMIYHLVDADQNTISTVRVGITIIVEG
jgi:hypothetical protein